MKSGSKKAFKHNIEAEMHSGRPQAQSLAIAYDIKRKNRKKKASGGTVESGSRDMNMADGGEATTIRPDKGYGKIIMIEHNRDGYAEGGSISASNERRPMPDNRYDDSKMVSRNSGKKAPKDDSWTDTPTERQAVMNNGRKVLPIAKPRMVPSDSFSTRLYDEESRLQSSASPGPYGEQPPRHDDEEGPDRQGPKVPDMQREHNNGRKPYAQGGMLRKDSGIQEMEREDEAHLQSKESPSQDEGSHDAEMRDEEGQNRQGPKVRDMEDEHSTGRKPYAGGGKISDFHEDMDAELNPAHGRYSPDDSEDQPHDEEMMEHHDSIAAAVMAKRDRRAAQMSDSDIDEMMRLYNGGEIKSHPSIYSDDSDQADLSRNANEDANEEDQLSFNALRKENYSESEGLRQLDNPRDSGEHGDTEEMGSHDEHDMVDSIRRKMRAKRQF